MDLGEKIKYRQAKIQQALQAGEMVQISDNAFYYVDWNLKPYWREWLKKNRTKYGTDLQGLNSSYRGTTRIFFFNRKDATMFKLTEDVRRF